MAKFIIIMLFFSAGLQAQLEVSFDSATAAYNNGDYEKAISYYQEILDKGKHSAPLYYNLGNSYYKLNRIAPSIYYYEKALLLDPTDKEIQNNLAYAQQMTLDDIAPLPETTISKMYKSITGSLSFDDWSFLAVGFVLLFVLSYIAFYYLRYSTHKRLAFIASICAVILAAFATLIALSEYNAFKAQQPAIVFSEEIGVRTEPNNQSSEAFVLHEGTKVNVLDGYGDWKKIEISDGQTGWIPSKEIRILKDF